MEAVTCTYMYICVHVYNVCVQKLIVRANMGVAMSNKLAVGGKSCGLAGKPYCY